MFWVRNKKNNFSYALLSGDLCKPNSSDSFYETLKLYRYFHHGVKMCISACELEKNLVMHYTP